LFCAFVAGLVAIAPSNIFVSKDRKDEIEPPQITIHAAQEGCAVELDSTQFGKTDAQGSLLLADVEPGDHYIHVICPNEGEMTFLVSPKAGDKLEIHPDSASSTAAKPAGSNLEAAQDKIELRQLIQDAVRLRARGHIEETVKRLREAAKLDPENSDLHRELGITFLLVKEWKRARIEMLEAIRRDPSDADAHNGLGYALEKLGQLDEALKEYRKATQLEPDDLSYRQHYVDALSKVMAAKTPESK
jgi:tetratricopeptide (TPR) repeat protein